MNELNKKIVKLMAGKDSLEVPTTDLSKDEINDLCKARVRLDLSAKGIMVDFIGNNILFRRVDAYIAGKA